MKMPLTSTEFQAVKAFRNQVKNKEELKIALKWEDSDSKFQTLISKLKLKGLIERFMDQDEDGNQRVYFRITDEGIAALKETREFYS